MAHHRIVVEVIRFVYNEAGEQLDKQGKPIKEGGTAIQEPETVNEMFYLLHWGLETSMVYDASQYPIPYSQTVGICQHIKTGHIQTFLPSLIRVVGFEQNT